MEPSEVGDLLGTGRKVQVATVNPDGTPHLVTVFYALVGGKISFFTYRRSQKARNLARDPRITCLVEAGEDYGALRGAIVYGTARLVEEYLAVVEIGIRVVTRTMGLPDDEVAGYVEHTARKRVAYIVEPDRIVSWDHRKLAPQAASATGQAAGQVTGQAAGHATGQPTATGQAAGHAAGQAAGLPQSRQGSSHDP